MEKSPPTKDTTRYDLLAKRYQPGRRAVAHPCATSMAVKQVALKDFT